MTTMRGNYVIKAGGMKRDVLRAREQYLPGDVWDIVRESVPILCVDVLLSPNDDPDQVALIRRATYPAAGDGWCLVGGRGLRDERLPPWVGRAVVAPPAAR